MSFLAQKDILASLLPPADELNTDEAIDTLKAYAFVAQREEHDLFDMHRLFRLAMRNLLDERGEKEQQAMKMMGPHALVALRFRGEYSWYLLLIGRFCREEDVT